jgi:3-oxoacyl-[acyl-carrier-protein] synthase-3
MNVHGSSRAVRILGTGAALPPEVLTSLELDKQLGLRPGTVERKTGVRSRRVEYRSAAALGAEAARQALDLAGVDLADIDVIIAASATPDQPLPCNAALLHEQLAPERPIPAWDINASCLGFLVGLDVISTLIASGRYERVLLVAADVASAGLDWTHLEAAGIFGDGAAAAVLGPADGTDSAVVASAFATYSEGAHTCEIPGGGSRNTPGRTEEDPLSLMRFQMNGPAVFRLVSAHLPDLLGSLFASCEMTMGEIPLVGPHQASHHAMSYLRRRFDLSRDRVVDIYADRGNQVSASLPSALHEAIVSGRLQRGERALLVGTGAGLSMGGIILCY